ncbi:MAG: type I restriction endonuclease subunit R [Emticicia sp.]|uniref:type I restriction endonuclease subunit R n=1 Tax=Emticicia sp. TaxID=1930953 RepID=UPI003BA6903F
MAHNENTRVKIPAILHLCRLGYQYISLSNAKRDENTNIFTDIFSESIARINPELEDQEIKRMLEKISLVLDNEDLGEEFYKLLTATSGTKLIDFKNFDNNAFHIVTELTCKNGEDEFRPDITLLINGMPLAFIEVKKPNNREGILAEKNRINERFRNKRFRKFINISQLLMFSNNMEYDTESIVPIQGAFYATTSFKDTIFNCFREEQTLDLSVLLKPEDDTIENFVLKDNNLITLKHSPEFITNKEVNTPTNRTITSLFSKERFRFLLKFGIAYVREDDGLQKHIMRYPQVFATKAIETELDKGITKGIVWHTQGSGKTALAFYNTQFLTDYYQQKGIVPKFYFIVDRLDLLTQASMEFKSRGLIVHNVNSKEELIADFKTQTAIHNKTGQREITVVNIHKFKEETTILKTTDYNINIQRVYFLDEVHRSYDPKGSFLANLTNSDKNAILIGLTGTPLIAEDRSSKATFGNYYHKYYYNASIADGYTLKLIREDIETTYKVQLVQAMKEIEILKGKVNKKYIYAHERFVEPMLDYIVHDFTESRIKFGDKTIGAMVVCDSSEQAKMLQEIFNTKYAVTTLTNTNPLTSALILHDIGSKEERKVEVKEFKEGKIDILFVYNMLLTGFDAKRLKKLYLGRVVKDHNLLQTLTRVNRPYKNFQYGYVVDFADISQEFDATNRAYFDELQQELGDEMETYSNLFKSKEEIDAEIKEIKEQLFHFDLKNAENFSRQITEIEDRKQVLEIKKALGTLRELYNVIRHLGHFDLLEKTDFRKFNDLFKAASDRLQLLNDRDSVMNSPETTNLLNVALENVLFMFRKRSESELVLADQLKDTLRKTREALSSNFDQRDPEFTSLYEELKRLFSKKNLDEVSQDEMKANIGALRLIYNKATEINRKNNLLKAKYENDVKFARVHKRLVERGNVSQRESEIHEILTDIKQQADDKILINQRLLNNEPYFEQNMLQMVIKGFQKTSVKLAPDSAKYINTCVVKEYLNEFHGITKW